MDWPDEVEPASDSVSEALEELDACGDGGGIKLLSDFWLRDIVPKRKEVRNVN